MSDIDNRQNTVKVCHMTSVHRSDDVRIFHKECASLATAGYDVYLVAPGESREEKGVKVVGVGEKPKKRLQRMVTFSRRVYHKALELDCDIYHFHDPELLPYGQKLKQKGKIVIFDSHEFYGLQIKEKKYLPTIIRSIVAKAYMNYEKKVCLYIDAVVAICTLSGEDYFRGRAKNTVMIPNTPILKSMPMSGIRKERAFTIIYAGGLTKTRGISELVHAAYEAGCKLVLCGKFESEAYCNEILNGRYKDCILYKGQLPIEQVEELYAQSDVGIATMHCIGQNAVADTLATKIYEYMMFGLPVIASDFNYTRVLVYKYDFGICVMPNNIDKLKNGLVFLRTHPEEARRMGNNGRAAVEKEFNWKAEEKKLLALYEEII